MVGAQDRSVQTCPGQLGAFLTCARPGSLKTPTSQAPTSRSARSSAAGRSTRFASRTRWGSVVRWLTTQPYTAPADGRQSLRSRPTGSRFRPSRRKCGRGTTSTTLTLRHTRTSCSSSASRAPLIAFTPRSSESKGRDSSAVHSRNATEKAGMVQQDNLATTPTSAAASIFFVSFRRRDVRENFGVPRDQPGVNLSITPGRAAAKCPYERSLCVGVGGWGRHECASVHCT